MALLRRELRRVQPFPLTAVGAKEVAQPLAYGPGIGSCIARRNPAEERSRTSVNSRSLVRRYQQVWDLAVGPFGQHPLLPDGGQQAPSTCSSPQSRAIRATSVITPIFSKYWSA